MTEVMVVKRELVLGNDNFQGFRTAKEGNYEQRILENYQWMPRALAEENLEYKQPIGYALIVNSLTKQVFAYQRAKKEVCKESRLRGKFSWGIGGHIEKTDHEVIKNPITTSTLREIGEELSPLGEVQLKVLGYINDEMDSVGQVHIGILYVVETTMPVVSPISNEILNGKLRTLKEIEHICNQNELSVEGWSRIALEPLKRYLS